MIARLLIAFLTLAVAIPAGTVQAQEQKLSEDQVRLQDELETLKVLVEYYRGTSEREDQPYLKDLADAGQALLDVATPLAGKATGMELFRLQAILHEAVLLMDEEPIRYDHDQKRAAAVAENLDTAASSLTAAALRDEQKIPESLTVLKQSRIDRQKAMATVLAQVDWQNWISIPVLHDGRIQPLGSFAEEIAVLVTGRSKWTDEETKVKYSAPELVFAWVSGNNREWLEKPVLRCEYQPLRRLLDARRTTYQTKEVDGDNTETVFDPLPHSDLRPGTLNGTVQVDGQTVAFFEVTRDGLFLFRPPVDDLQSIQSDLPLFQSLMKNNEHGWYGGVLRNSFSTTPEVFPVGGSFNPDERTFSLNWNQPPGGKVKCQVSYSYQRNVLPEKGTYVSLLDIYDVTATTQQGGWVFLSQDAQTFLEDVGPDGLGTSQLAETRKDKELGTKIAELNRHAGNFSRILGGRNVYVVPGLDPRALAEPENPKDQPEHWVSLGSLLSLDAPVYAVDPTIAALMASSPGELTQLVERDVYPAKHLIQLAQAQKFKYRLRPELELVAKKVSIANRSYSLGKVDDLEKNLGDLKAHLTHLAHLMEDYRSEMGPVDVKKELVVSNEARFQSVMNRLDLLRKVLLDPTFKNRVEPAQQGRLKEVVEDPLLAALLSRPFREGDEVPQPKITSQLSQLVGITVDQLYTIRPQLVEEMPALFKTPLDFGELTPMLVKAYKPLELDEEQFALSAYPEPGAMDLELAYNNWKPFASAWIVFLGAFVVVISSLMVRSQKTVYSLGMLATLGAIIYSSRGFMMRIQITSRAPVTNMYETVIWVAFIVACLGLWFCVLPMIWPGLKWAWRLTGLPIRPQRNEEGRVTGLGMDRITPEDRHRLFAPMLVGMQSIFSVLRLGLFGYIVYYLTNSNTTFNITSLTPPIDGKVISFGQLGTWAVGISTVLISSWFLSHAVCTLLVSGLTIWPEGRREDRSKLWEQVFARRWFLLGALPVACFAMMLAHFVGIRNPDILNPRIGSITAVLRNNYWLTIHVLTIVSSYGAGALAWGLGNIALAYYLFGRYHRDKSNPELLAKLAPKGHVPADPGNREVIAGDTFGSRMSKTFQALRPGRFGRTMRAGFGGMGAGDQHLETSQMRPPREVSTLANYSYKGMQVAVLLLAAGTILGGLWADVSWGRFWDWDPKEVWALISLLVYLVVLHGRFAGWVGTFGTNAGSVLCFNAILMSWYGVNFVLPKIPGWLDGTGRTVEVGLHSYASGTTDGMAWIFGAVVLNGVFLIAAMARYVVETTDLFNETKAVPELEETPQQPTPVS